MMKKKFLIRRGGRFKVTVIHQYIDKTFPVGTLVTYRGPAPKKYYAGEYAKGQFDGETRTRYLRFADMAEVNNHEESTHPAGSRRARNARWQAAP